MLGADPENFVARVGLGVVAEGIGALDEAIWQWERALELEPNHADLRVELKKANATRKHNGNERIKLSRAALARIYMRGEQYDKAASELRATLGGKPGNGEGSHERFDLEVALAEALYRGGHMREAAEVCGRVLKVLPNALKPNLILGDIFRETGREDEARALFEKAQSLDPENHLAVQLLNPPGPLEPRMLTIDAPGDDRPFVAQPIEAPAQATLKEAERALPWLAPSSEQEEAATSGAPDWLKALHSAPPAADSTSAAPADADLPEWLKALRAGDQSSAAPALSARVAEPEIPSGDMPDWLKALGDLRASAAAAETAAVEAQPASHETTTVAEQAESTAPVAEPSTAELHEPPQAIHEETVALPVLPETIVQKPTPAETTVQTAAPRETAAQTLAPTETLAQPPAQTATTAQAPAQTEPEWITALRARGEAIRTGPLPPLPAETETPAPGHPPATTLSDEEMLPDWLRALAAAEPATPAPVAEPAPSEQPATTAAPVETPRIPTGEVEQYTRLDLARALKDIDLESSLELYALMDGASDSLRQQAIADLQPLASGNARVQEIIGRLQGVTLAPPPVAVETPVETAAPQVAPPAEETPHTPREATMYLDDSSAPPSIETQTVPTGEAEYAARLELARTLSELDLDSALDQYALMAGASAALVQQAQADLLALARMHASHPRVQHVLDQLQAAPQRAPDELEQSAPEPAPPSPAKPVVTEEALEQSPAAAESQSEVPAPLEPVVTEETMEPLDQAQPEPAAEAPAAREPSAYLADTTALPSVESRAAPTGAAQYQARLDLARAWKFMDVDEALEQYASLRDAPETLRRQAIGDVEQLVKRNPQAQRVLDQLRGAAVVPAEAQAAAATKFGEPAAQAPDAGAPSAAAAIEATSTEPAATQPATAQGAPAREPLTEIVQSAAAPAADSPAARLDLARSLRAVNVHESAAQYRALLATPLLPQVIDDLSQLIAEQPDERGLRVLLADAFTRAGRLQDAIEQYRLLV